MERLTGTVTVLLIGSLPPKELNRLAASLSLQDVRREKKGTSMRLRAEDFNALRHLLRGSGLKVRILKREGLPFVRVMLRHKAAFVVALLASLLVIWGLSQTVLEVRVSGIHNETMKRQLLELMAGLGAERGAFREKVDPRAIEESVLRSFPNLTFASLHQRGVTLELFVVEAVKPPEIFRRSEPVNIVASCEGLITKVTVLSGMAWVRPGDTVRQGQLLIQGYDPSSGSVHANGEVYARIWQTGAGEAELYETVRVPTGRAHERMVIRCLGLEICLFQGKVPFKDYNISKEGGFLLDGLYLPIAWEKQRFTEVELRRQQREEEEVRRQAAQRALTDALNLVPGGARIVDKRLEYSKIGEEKLAARLTLESFAQIGVSVQDK
ncbi:MAG: sporulation protein YqfD [Christensenellaceae bacterium]|jgi:similar to stage IV sporulation protein|nr:sporulation protein YqfD [Christensenellaceae bacterium]